MTARSFDEGRFGSFLDALYRADVEALQSMLEEEVSSSHAAVAQQTEGERPGSARYFDPIKDHHERTGLTALHIAVGINSLPLVRYLVEVENAPFEPDKLGRWPSAIAAECGASEELCDYIVEKEAQATAASE